MIEERAREFADRHEEAELNLRGLGGVYGYNRINNAEICAYKRGAEEQRKIDIDKAYDWIKDNIKNYLCTLVRSCGGLNKEVIIDISRDFYYDFKKSMEE